MSDATERAGERLMRPAPRLGRVVGVLIAMLGIVGLAAWMVGPRPRPVDMGLPTTPPPLALPSDTSTRSPLARAAAMLAAGDLRDARAAFTAIVAESPDGEPGQVGLVLSRWRSTGPVSVERDLQQLAREYPQSAFVMLHLGLVQVLLDADRSARRSLREARRLGIAAADPTSLRMARLADDVLHPDAFRGPLPVLVQASEVEKGDEAVLRTLLGALARDDRARILAAARQLGRSTDPMARIAAVAAMFDKDDPAATTARLRALARAPGVPAAARDRAVFVATLADLWGGGGREAGCAGLSRSSAASTDAATRRIAAPIRTELCAAGPAT